MGCCFYLGALIGGASRDQQDLFYEFGKNLGIAFQLHDDILDAYAGDKSSFGKQVGGDILSNKKTILLIKALQNANQLQREELMQWLKTKEFNKENKVIAVKGLFNATNALKEAENEQKEYFQKALLALESLRLDESKKQSLKVFASDLMHRTK